MVVDLPSYAKIPSCSIQLSSITTEPFDFDPKCDVSRSQALHHLLKYTTLDNEQSKALLAALQQELCCIQGMFDFGH
jgi:hypothetical protein